MARMFLPREEFERPFCPKGHYKPEVGIVHPNRTCYRCALDRSNEYARKRREEANRGKPPLLQSATSIRDTREYLGLSPEGFARAIGVDRSSVYAWEAGTKRMRSDIVERIVPVVSILLRYRKEYILEEQKQRARKERLDRDTGIPSRGRKPS